MPISTAGMEAALSHKGSASPAKPQTMRPAPSSAQRSPAATAALAPLVLSPGDTAALARFKSLFSSGLAHGVSLARAEQYARAGRIFTMIVDPAHPFTFAFVTTDGTVLSTTRHGPQMPAAFVTSGANVVVLPPPRSIWSYLLNPVVLQLVISLLFIIVLVAFMVVMARRYTVRNRVLQPQDTGDTTFDRIAGQDHAKLELREVVESLRYPERFATYGLKPTQGVLLAGPPGNGKTMLAKAVAKESGVRFYAMSGSDFVELFVGVGAARVRSLFKHARRARFRDRILLRSPTPAVIFIDEIDAVGGKRGRSIAGNDERESTLNQILVEMDGIVSDASKKRAPIVVIAATNRSDTLDEALLRRFPQKVDVLPPDLNARARILKVHCKGVPTEKIDFAELARMTPGFSGANLAALVQAASLIARREKSRVVTQAHFSHARQRVMLGTPRPQALRDPAQRRVVAVHEAGHALAALRVPHADEPIEASIIPHGGSLGHVSSMPPEDEVITSRARIMARLTVMMAGRAAEEEIFGHEMATTGAAGDRRQAIELITTMITEYGLSRNAKHLGAVRGAGGIWGAENKALPGLGPEEMNLLGVEVRAVFEEVCTSAAVLMRERRTELLMIARGLLAHTTLSGEAMRRIAQRCEGMVTELGWEQMLDVNFALSDEALKSRPALAIAAMEFARKPPGQQRLP